MTSRPPGIHHITGARRSLSEDIRSRQTRYLLSMGVRTACFLLAVVTSGPLRWVFFAAAVVLPYLAVVIANGGRDRAEPAPRVPDPERLAIDAAPGRSATIVYEGSASIVFEGRSTSMQYDGQSAPEGASAADR